MWCFVLLVDWFICCGVDLVLLVKYGLIEELLLWMVVVGGIVLGLLLVCKLGCSIIGVFFIIVDFKLSN